MTGSTIWLGYLFTLIYDAEWLENRNILDSLEHYKYGDKRKAGKFSGESARQAHRKHLLSELIDEQVV